jgi:hypothetical protein
MEKEYKERMIALLTKLGADNPQSWLQSEERENIAQTARFLFLHEVRKILDQSSVAEVGGAWRQSPERQSPDEAQALGEKALAELTASGTDEELLNAIYRAGASSALFAILNLLDGTYATESESEPLAPRWVLMEIVGSIDQSHLTGRVVDGTHESFQSLYKTD